MRFQQTKEDTRDVLLGVPQALDELFHGLRDMVEGVRVL